MKKDENKSCATQNEVHNDLATRHTMKTIYGEPITRIIDQWDNIATCLINGQVQLIHITKIIIP